MADNSRLLAVLAVCNPASIHPSVVRIAQLLVELATFHPSSVALSSRVVSQAPLPQAGTLHGPYIGQSAIVRCCSNRWGRIAEQLRHCLHMLPWGSYCGRICSQYPSKCSRAASAALEPSLLQLLRPRLGIDVAEQRQQPPPPVFVPAPPQYAGRSDRWD